MTASICSLPDELVSAVLQLLPPTDRFGALQVSRRWRALARQRRLWRRDGCGWEHLVATLHSWFLQLHQWNPTSPEFEPSHVYLVKREGAGTFSQTAPGPLSKALRGWLDEFSGGTNSLGRTNRDPAAPLILNGRPLSPGFRRYVPPSGDLFSGSDTEAYTWPEAGQLVHMRMRSDGQQWLLRVRLHWAAGLPIALQFTQTAHARDGSVIVGTSNVFQKRRGFSRTRIEKELSEDVSEERRCGVWLDLPGEGAEGTLVGTVLGPPGSPYHGGRFQLEITVPREYPFHAPRARFLTKIWHPNVDHRTGAVCLINIPPSLLLVKMLIHFQGLMSLPDLDDPVDPVVAAQARDNPETFAAIAQHWTWAYASPTQPVAGLEDGVRRVQAALGLPEEEARERLARAGWREEVVIAGGGQDGL